MSVQVNHDIPFRFFGWVGGILLSSALLQASETQPFRVVLDPGHGGNDLGTVYEAGPSRVAEKDLTLALALESARILRAQKIEVTLTRTQDRELPLGNRTALANSLRADVFVSIHLNSQSGALGTSDSPESGPSMGPQGSASGIETYILNNTTDASSHRLARLENSVLGGTPAGGQENLDVALILKDLTLDHNLADSKQLACAIQNNLIVSTSTALDRGVKQALFHVLLGADMPSVLVEAGFLSHSRDRAMLLNPTSRARLANAIAEGVLQYQRQHSRSASPGGSRGGTQGRGVSAPCKVR